MSKKTSKKTHKDARTYKGLPLVDASKDLEICVTKNDVSTARKNDPSKCAAANAIRREMKTEVEVHISRTYVKDNKKKVWVRFLTPNSVGREITSFDRAAIFEPGTYNLKAPSPGQRLGIHRGKSTNTGKGLKRSVKQHITANIRESAR